MVGEKFVIRHIGGVVRETNKLQVTSWGVRYITGKTHYTVPWSAIREVARDVRPGE